MSVYTLSVTQQASQGWELCLIQCWILYVQHISEMCTQCTLFEWMKNYKHPAFKSPEGQGQTFEQLRDYSAPFYQKHVWESTKGMLKAWGWRVWGSATQMITLHCLHSSYRVPLFAPWLYIKGGKEKIWGLINSLDPDRLCPKAFLFPCCLQVPYTVGWES